MKTRTHTARAGYTLNLLAALGATALAGCNTAADEPAPSTPPGTTPPGTPPTDTPPGTPPTTEPEGPQPVRPRTLQEIPGHENLPQDNTPKEAERLVAPEVLMRSYLTLFGGLAPLTLQTQLRAMNGATLFDTWNDYLSALGVPDHAADIPRSPQTNALMLAAFERIGVALCDRAVTTDFAATPPARKSVFRFDLPAGGRALTDAEFATRFDVLHRLFLGYPASLAPTARTARFQQLYRDAVARRTGAGAVTTAFSAPQAGWAVVCYGLIRHPEFHLY
jgi:hypothetical protein